MRLPNAAHKSRPWRIREIAPDFTLEDAWAIPVNGGAEDFQTLLEVMVSLDPANAEALPLRVLWRLRDRLGSWFDLGRISAPIDNGRDGGAGKLPIPGTNETSLAERLNADLGGRIRPLLPIRYPFLLGCARLEGAQCRTRRSTTVHR